MQALPRFVTVGLALSLGLALTPLLTGCNPAQLVSGAVEQAVKDQTGVDVKVNPNGGAVSLPADFPKDVPIVSGTVTSSVSVGTGSNKGWSVIVKVSNAKNAYTEVKSKLQAAGFSIDVDAAQGGDYLVSGSKGNLNVLAATSGTGSDTVMTYTVTQ